MAEWLRRQTRIDPVRSLLSVGFARTGSSPVRVDDLLRYVLLFAIELEGGAYIIRSKPEADFECEF